MRSPSWPRDSSRSQDGKVLWQNPQMVFTEKYNVTMMKTAIDPNAFLGQNVNALERLASGSPGQSSARSWSLLIFRSLYTPSRSITMRTMTRWTRWEGMVRSIVFIVASWSSRVGRQPVAVFADVSSGRSLGSPETKCLLRHQRPFASRLPKANQILST